MKTTIFIQNLKCGGCANTIKSKLNNLSNISDVKVSIDEDSVTFNYSDDLALASAKETLKINGYPEIGAENTLGTKAKSFVSCAVGRVL